MLDKADEASFALEEYKALRTEILYKMEKCFKILSLGVGGITIIFGFVFQYQIYDLFFVLPFLILANLLYYRAEFKSTDAIGKYVCKIENSFYRKGRIRSEFDNYKVFGDLGWENELRYDEKRLSEKNKLYERYNYVVTTIFISLYLLCILEIYKEYPHELQYYVIIFIYIIILLLTNINWTSIESCIKGKTRAH